MSVSECSRGELELTGFRVEAVAQTLYAFSISETFRDQSQALALPSAEARAVAAYIAAHVEAMGSGPLPV